MYMTDIPEPFLLPSHALLLLSQTLPAVDVSWAGMNPAMLITLPFLLLLSGVFSGSETALFALTGGQRIAIARRFPRAEKSIAALFRNEQRLLITLLLGNTTINTLYFVMTSLLLMHAEMGVTGKALLAFLFLFTLILCGEVLPKAIADRNRIRCATLCAGPMRILLGVLSPLAGSIARFIIRPLSRLVTPRPAPEPLEAQELAGLLSLSGKDWDIDRHEQAVLRDLLSLRHRRVREIMTPRVSMHAIEQGSGREDVRRLVSETRLTSIPIFDEDLDTILGILKVKPYLLDERIDSLTDPRAFVPARYVPEGATLDQMLVSFRTSRARSAIVVDEFGGTEGLVTLEDLVSELVGELDPDRSMRETPRFVKLGTWEVPGDMPIHEWAEAFDLDMDSTQVSTVGGYIMERLDRIPDLGDKCRHGHLLLRVTEVKDHSVQTVQIIDLAFAEEETP